MFRGTGFGAIKSLPAILALCVCGSVEERIHSLVVPLVSGNRAKDMVVFASIVPALLAAVLVYSLGTRLLQRLADTAY